MNFGAQRPLYIVAKCFSSTEVNLIKKGNQKLFFVHGESAEGYPLIKATQSTDCFECVLDSTLNIDTAKHVTVQIKGMVPNKFETTRKAYSCLGNTYPLQSF